LVTNGFLLLELGEDDFEEAGDCILLLELGNCGFDHSGVFLSHDPIKLIGVVRL